MSLPFFLTLKENFPVSPSSVGCCWLTEGNCSVPYRQCFYGVLNCEYSLVLCIPVSSFYGN